MRLRVVCGLEVTIAIFCPTSRFTSVDFPAFGRPMMATNPDRNLFFAFSLLAIGVCRAVYGNLTLGGNSLHLLADSYPQHLSLVGFHHFKSMALQVNLVSRRRHLAGDVAQQTGQRSYRLVGLLAKMYAQKFLDCVDGQATAHDQSSVRLAHHVRCKRLPLVAAFTDNLFDEIFHGSDPRYRSM